jgi:hypothetical protein
MGIKVGLSSQVKNISFKSVWDQGVEENILTHSSSNENELLKHVARMEETGKTF